MTNDDLNRIKKYVAAGLFDGGDISANDAEPLLAHVDRLRYLLAEAAPYECMCDVEGPDGIKCLRCEIEAAGVAVG